MKTRLFQLTELGQEVWFDDLYRELITSGKLKRMIDEDGVSGLTSNPTIFENAFKNDPIYIHDIEKMAGSSRRIDEIYDELLFTDIRLAAQAFEELYDSSEGELGYACLELSPLLAHDAEATVREVERLFAESGVENIMVKVPGTAEGVAAIEELVARGYNINVTLLFSVKHYESVARAYIRGLKRRKEQGLPVDRVRGVASVFLSRIDTAVDNWLDKIINSDVSSGTRELAASLKGKAAVAVGRLVYRSFKDIFGTEEFYELEAEGAHVQKPLWASTGTKNPQYSDVKYVEELIYPDTVITMPEKTLMAFRDHGNAALAPEDYEEQEQVIEKLKELGIDIDEVCDELQADGEKKFIDSYLNIRKAIEQVISA